MTLNVANLHRARRVLGGPAVPFVDAFALDVVRTMAMRRQDSALISEFDRVMAIMEWRQRFNSPAGNPFR